MGHKKIAQVRELATARGWLVADTVLPDGTETAKMDSHPGSVIAMSPVPTVRHRRCAST
ncbi:MAG: hypothetical protein V4508_22905 [Pseudomonadota bacterium]